MTREEAIEIIKCGDISNRWGDDGKEAERMAIKALEQETVTEFADRCRECGAKYGKLLKQEPCSDAVSRQAVFEQINCWIGSGEYRYTNATDYLNKRIKALQAVNPQPKTGHWISHYDEDAKEGWYECDRCHTERAFNTDYCPDCGCRMVEPQESEVSDADSN